MEAEADGEAAIAVVTAGASDEDRGVGQRAAGEHRAPRDRERPQPVDEAPLDVLGHADRRPDAAEEHARW